MARMTVGLVSVSYTHLDVYKRQDLEHIVLGRVHCTAVYQGSALRERLHHVLLRFGGLGHDVVVLHLGRGQVQLVGGFDVRDLLKDCLLYTSRCV